MKKIFKRLIKSTLFDAQGSENTKDYMEIYMNPTQEEINIVKNADPFKSVRGIIDNGNIYIWTGDIIHDQLKNPKVNISNSLHFAYEKNRWKIDTCNLKITFKEVYDILNNYKNQLSQIGNLSGKIFIGDTIDKFGSGDIKGFFDFPNWNEMENYVVKLK